MGVSYKIKLALVIGIVITIFIVVALISKEETGLGVNSLSKEPIKIGAILPLSGTSSYFGEYEKEGIELARDEINNEGGIKGRKLEIIYEDSGGDTTKGLSAYQNLVKVKEINILLSSLTHIILGIAPSAEKDKVIVFSIGGAAPKISEAGDYVFRHNLLPQTEMRILTDFLYNDKNIKEVGIIAVNTESGVSYKDEFKKRFEDLGGEIKFIQMHEKGATDYRTILTKIKEKNNKNIFDASYAEEYGLIIKQARELGLNDINWFSGYVTESPKLLEFGGDATNGIIYTHFLDPESSSLKKYQKKYQEKYGKDSETYAILAYDNIRILAEAMKHCSNPEDATCIKNELYKIKNFPGVTGEISFDENGDTQKEIIIKTIKNGEFVKY